jgi:hypothetical protein
MKKTISAFILFLIIFISLSLNPSQVCAAINCYTPHNAADDCKIVGGYIVCELPGGTHQCCDTQADCDALQTVPPTCASQNPAASCYPNTYVCAPQNPPINPNIGCAAGEQCGVNCVVASTSAPAPATTANVCGPCIPCETQVWTALGCIPTNPSLFIGKILGIGIGIGGGIAFLLILFGGFQMLTSAGNPEKLNAGKELVTSAIAGLLIIIFSIFILRLIGVTILHIPGFE